MPYRRNMHAVVETARFLASADREGIDDEERASIVAHIAANPTVGDLIPETGGARMPCGARSSARRREEVDGARLFSII